MNAKRLGTRRKKRLVVLCMILALLVTSIVPMQVVFAMEETENTDVSKDDSADDSTDVSKDDSAEDSTEDSEEEPEETSTEDSEEEPEEPEETSETTYTVEWYDTIDNTIRETEVRNAVVGDVVSVTEEDKNVDGYIFFESFSKNCLSATVEEGGVTILKLYFRVNIEKPFLRHGNEALYLDKKPEDFEENPIIWYKDEYTTSLKGKVGGKSTIAHLNRGYPQGKCLTCGTEGINLFHHLARIYCDYEGEESEKGIVNFSDPILVPIYNTNRAGIVKEQYSNGNELSDAKILVTPFEAVRPGKTTLTETYLTYSNLTEEEINFICPSCKHLYGEIEPNWHKHTYITNFTVYANYYLHYDANANGDAVSDMPNTAEQLNVADTKADFTVSEQKPYREGYEFLGWADSKDATVPDYTGNETLTLIWESGATVEKTVYAVWKKSEETPTVRTIDYLLHYDPNANGDTVTNMPATDSQLGIVETKADFTVSEQKPYREGYEFLGWADSEDATVPDYIGKEIITLNWLGEESGYIVEKTVYAVWKKNSEPSNPPTNPPVNPPEDKPTTPSSIYIPSDTPEDKPTNPPVNPPEDTTTTPPSIYIPDEPEDEPTTPPDDTLTDMPTTPKTPSEETTTDTPKKETTEVIIPKTGDDLNIALYYLVIMCAAFLTMFSVRYIKRKKG